MACTEDSGRHFNAPSKAKKGMLTVMLGYYWDLSVPDRLRFRHAILAIGRCHARSHASRARLRDAGQGNT